MHAVSGLSVFAAVVPFQLESVLRKETRGCFGDKKKYPIRSTEIDHWLPKTQLDAEPCMVVRITIGDEKIKFRDLIGSVLGIPCDKANSHFADQLKTRGNFLSLTQIELLIDLSNNDQKERQEHYAFVMDKNSHIVPIRVYRRTDDSYGVNLSRAHCAEPGDYVYFKSVI